MAKKCKLETPGKKGKPLPRLQADFNAQQIRGFQFNDYDTDYLAECLGVGRDHHGPFEVDVDEEEFAEFWRPNGVEDWRQLTEGQLARARGRYGYTADMA